MARDLITVKDDLPENFLAAHEQFLQVRVGGQLFGIPVFRVRDVLKPQKVTRIPLAKPEILGLINLRGRIITVIDTKKRLSMDTGAEAGKRMFVVVESGNELYCLEVDRVGDTITMAVADFDNNPENMGKEWKDLSRGVFKLDKELMLVLDIGNLVNF